MITDKQKIGDWGEINGIKLLKKNGFTDITDLNKIKHNFPVYDLLAKKGNTWYAFTSKTRNKFNPGDGKLNRQYNILVKKKSRYKLDKAAQLLKEVFNLNKFKKYWIACPIDYSKKTQTFYFGDLEKIKNWSNLTLEDTYIGIKMNEEALITYNILGRAIF